MYDNLLEVQLINRNWARAPYMLFAEVQAVQTLSLAGNASHSTNTH